MSITVVIPTRGRPDAAREAVESIRATAVRADTMTILAVDRDDPQLGAYQDMVDALPAPEIGSERRPSLVVLDAGETGDLVRATNTVSMRVAAADPECVIANFGDDHRPRTVGWDREVLAVMARPGIAYGDDLLQHERLPTAPFIAASIVLELGWYALPCCRHLFIDDAWRALGEAAGVLRYLPDVVIEHCHPAAGKADWDAGYERANAGPAVERDRREYLRWRNGPLFHLDAAAVRRGVRVR